MSDIEGIREGVRRVGESEPLIALGKGMGLVVDKALDIYRDVTRAVKRRMDPPRDLALPKDRRRKAAPVQRSMMRRAR